MKPREYIKKFGFDSVLKYSRNLFISDLAADFISLIDSKKSMHPFKAFEVSMVEIREKFDRIVVGSILTQQEQGDVWKQFSSRVIFPLRDQRFGDFTKARHEYRYATDNEYRRKHDSWQMHKREEEWWEEEMKRLREDNRRRMEEEFGRREDFFRNLLGRLRGEDIFSHLIELEINTDGWSSWNIDEKTTALKDAYRTLSKAHHPDLGGDSEKFIKVKTSYNALMDTLTIK